MSYWRIRAARKVQQQGGSSSFMLGSSVMGSCLAAAGAAAGAAWGSHPGRSGAQREFPSLARGESGVTIAARTGFSPEGGAVPPSDPLQAKAQSLALWLVLPQTLPPLITLLHL